MLGLQQHNAIPCVVGLEIFPLLLRSATKTDKASAECAAEARAPSAQRVSRSSASYYKYLTQLTVNSPVMGSKPTCTVCSKLEGSDITGFSCFFALPAKAIKPQ